MMDKQTRYPNCPLSLDASEIERYRNEGYLVFENALSADEVQLVKAALTKIVEDAVSNRDDYQVKADIRGRSSQSGVIFQHKSSRMFFQLEPGVDPGGKPAHEIEAHIRKYMWFEDSHDIFRLIYTDHPRIQGVVRSILGDAVELYQSMALVKPAHIGVDKPWHQDNAYFAVRDLDAVLGTWIALDDATIENGCMHFIPGKHAAGPLRHYHTHDCEIVPDRIDTSSAVAVELKAGGIVLFHGNLPHYTPPNRSGSRRRAIQYHYRRRSNEIVSKETYFEIFKEADGTPASCAAAAKNGF